MRGPVQPELLWELVGVVFGFVEQLCARGNRVWQYTQCGVTEWDTLSFVGQDGVEKVEMCKAVH